MSHGETDRQIESTDEVHDLLLNYQRDDEGLSETLERVMALVPHPASLPRLADPETIEEDNIVVVRAPDRDGRMSTVTYRTVGKIHTELAEAMGDAGASTTPESDSEQDAFDAYEAKLDELNDGLLEAYAAGFAKALENHDIDAPVDPDPDSLQENRFVQESHHYYWDGRTKPLAFWLREQFGIESGGAAESEVDA